VIFAVVKERTAEIFTFMEISLKDLSSFPGDFFGFQLLYDQSLIPQQKLPPKSSDECSSVSLLPRSYDGRTRLGRLL